MNGTLEEDLTVDKEMVSLVKTALALKKRLYVYENGRHRYVSDDEKTKHLISVFNMLIKMGEVVTKRKDMYGKICNSGLEKKELSDDRLVYILQKWKYLKEAKKYQPIAVEYVLYEERLNQ